MPKPWELDWSAANPAPGAMPLPITPFFGRQRPPMLDDDGLGLDPNAVPAGAYGMIGADPSAMLAAGPSPMAAGDPLLRQAGVSSPMAAVDPSAMLSATPSSPPSSGSFQPQTPSSGYAESASFQPGAAESQPTPDSTSRPPAEGQFLLQPAILNSWTTSGSQAALPSVAQPDAFSPSVRFAAQQVTTPHGLSIPPMGTRPSSAQPPRGDRAGSGQPSAPARQAMAAPAGYGRNGATPPLQPVPELYDAHGAVNRGVLGDRIERVGERSHQWQVSPAGAIGVMQLEPGTAAETARRLGIAFDDHRFRTDADYNRMLGRAHVNYLLNRYHGSALLATAAYNAGVGNVHRWIARFGDPSQGEISDAEFARRIPARETRAYIQRVIYGQMPVQQRPHRHRHR